jgi:hypothetical protein
MTADERSAEKSLSNERGVSNHLDNSGKNRIETLDIGLKERQIIKVELEIAQLKNTWPRFLDIVSKAGLPIIVIATGVAAYFGLPQKTIELEKTRSDIRAAESDLADVNKKLASSKLENEKLQREQVVLIEGKKSADRESVAANADIAEQNKMSKTLPKAADKVFIQFKGEIAREKINGLRTTLSSAGIEAAPAERLGAEYKSMVKYFSKSPEVKARADKIATITQDFFKAQGCPLANINVTYAPPPSGTASPIEVWISHACKTATQ